MRITVYNAKGGAGKTPIATNVALDREYAVGTNERYHLFDTFIPDDRIIAVDMDEEFPEIPARIDIIFDLAGSISAHSASIISALGQSDLVIVPIWNEIKALTAGRGTIAEVANFTDQILVVATKLEKRKGEVFTDWRDSADFINIATAVKANASVPVAVLPLKLSRAFDTIFEKERSIRQLMKVDPLARHSFREVARQFDAVYQHMDGVSHAKQKQHRRA